MINYYGTPITPADALVGLSGKNFFVSFWRPDQIGLVSEIASTFAIDNGAFSAYSNGAKVDWEKYKDFVHEWMLPNMNFHVIPDVIGGTWQENMELIREWDVPRAAPVWHMAEPLEMLGQLVRNFEVVCIGGHVGVYGDVGNTVWWNRIDEAMGIACDDHGKPKCKIHGLRLLDPALRSIPFYSADSSNLARHLTQSGMSKRTAALLIAERTESKPGALRWEGIPRQQNLFEYTQRFNPSPEANAWRL